MKCNSFLKRKFAAKPQYVWSEWWNFRPSLFCIPGLGKIRWKIFCHACPAPIRKRYQRGPWFLQHFHSPENDRPVGCPRLRFLQYCRTRQSGPHPRKNARVVTCRSCWRHIPIPFHSVTELSAPSARFSICNRPEHHSKRPGLQGDYVFRIRSRVDHRGKASKRF